MKAEGRRQKAEGNCAGSFDGDGYDILEGVISRERCDELAAELSDQFAAQQSSAKSKIGGIRNLLQTSKRVVEFASCTESAGHFRSALGQNAFPVRAIFFDKTSESNWLVPWHQDLSIAVVERVETAGFGGWSVKDGVVHVQPPSGFLESMAIVRLHLDDCNANNGALKVIPGSHMQGRLNAAQISEWVNSAGAVTCEARKGDVLLMRPLLLHSSSAAVNPSHRRVLHIEYATRELPGGLKWFVRK